MKSKKNTNIAESSTEVTAETAPATDSDSRLFEIYSEIVGSRDWFGEGWHDDARDEKYFRAALAIARNALGFFNEHTKGDN